MNRREHTGPEEQGSPSHARPGEDACCGHGRAQEGGGHGCCGGGGGCHEPEQAYVFSRKQIRELDRLAVEEFGMPSILLMENAARGVAGVVLEGLAGIEDPPPSALVVCGPGNNGGDGLAVARHLANRDVRVAVVLSGPAGKYGGDALANLRIVQKMGLPVFEAGGSGGGAVAEALERIGDPVVVVDALLGTGLDRPAMGVSADLIGRMNELKGRGCTLVAVDVPSGVDCDTGLSAVGPEGVAGPAVEADLTIALAGVKAGFLAMNAQKYIGELVVVDIGAPKELVRRLGRPLATPHLG